MPSENSEQDKSTQEEKNQVAVDTMDEKIRNIEQEHYNEIQSKTGEILVFDQYNGQFTLSTG